MADIRVKGIILDKCSRNMSILKYVDIAKQVIRKKEEKDPTQNPNYNAANSHGYPKNPNNVKYIN